MTQAKPIAASEMVDPWSMDFETYLATIRDFTQNELIPAEMETERDDEIPERIVDRMRALGFWAISLPREWGGLGWTQEQQVRLTFEFTQASCVYRSRFSTTIGLVSQLILEYGTEAQRQSYLPRIAKGEITGSFTLTEVQAGSDAGNVASTARKDGDHYVINGTKRYITNGPDAELFLVIAKVVDADGNVPGGRKDPSVFLIDKGTPGIEAGPAYNMMGQRGSHVSDVYLTDCRVPASCLLGGVEGGGLKKGLRGINHARTHVAATGVGQGIRLMNEVLKFVNEREQFGQLIGEFQAMQVMIGESRAELSAAKALTLDVARRFYEDPKPFIDISAAKLFSTEMVGRLADRAVQIFGGQGYMTEQAVSRIARDVRVLRIFEGTSQIHQTNIAKSIIRDGVLKDF